MIVSVLSNISSSSTLIDQENTKHRSNQNCILPIQCKLRLQRLQEKGKIHRGKMPKRCSFNQSSYQDLTKEPETKTLAPGLKTKSKTMHLGLQIRIKTLERMTNKIKQERNC